MIYKPKETKYSKQFKGKKFNKISSCVSLQKLNGPMPVTVLKALNHARFSEKLLLTIRQTLAKKIKKQGKFFIRLLADVPVTKKPLEIRMGKGKGSVDHWTAKVIPGAFIIEIHEVSILKSHKLLREIQKKLPIETEIVNI